MQTPLGIEGWPGTGRVIATRAHDKKAAASSCEGLSSANLTNAELSCQPILV